MRSLSSQTPTPNLVPSTTARVPVIIATSPPQGKKPPRPSSRSSGTSTSSRTTLPNNSLATRKPRPGSALVANGRSRRSITPSASVGRPPSPVRATTTTISTTRQALPPRSTTPNTTDRTNRSSLDPSTAASVTPSTPNKNTPAAPRRTPSLRSPLFNRDNNAREGGMTRSTKTFTATMAPEKGPSHNPRQAPSVAKGMVGRGAPLTPKIATPSGGPPRIAQPAATTPHARRTHPGNSSAKEEYVSPVSGFLSNNITPRSGSRQSRVDSNQNSPSGTPGPDRADGCDSRGGSGLDVDSTRRAGALSPSGEAGRDAQASADAKFFFASDAKSNQPKPPPAPQPRMGSNFFYADGGAVGKKQNAHTPNANPTSPSFTPTLGHAPDNRSSKFMYASGIPNLGPPQSQPSHSRPSSVVSGTSRMTSGRPSQGLQSSSIPHYQRPASPVKMASHPALQPLPTSTRSPNTLAQSALPPTITAKRRISTEYPPSRSHSRSGSLSNPTVDSPPPPKRISSFSSDMSTPCSISSPTMTLASPLQPVEERMAEAVLNAETASHSDLHSPTKSPYPNDQLSELIANARRDRKVQDLEITNTSLTAINRSLERRLRKQTAELRRYRRLTRAGRISLTSTASSTFPRDSLASDTGTEGFDLSDLNEEEPEETEEESELSETDSGSDALPPEARAERDARHREKDERRLELDLTKHHEQLVDSQKINQSLKKCLNWTEELICEGRKALAYQVRASDIKLGGRILAPEDEDGDDDDDDIDIDDDDDYDYDGVGDSERGDDTIQGLGIIPDPDASWAKEPQDRDSGVEFPPEAG